MPEAKATEPKTPALKETSDETGVVIYVGKASRRIISSEDFQGLGSKSDAAEWNLQNNYRIETSKFDPKALAYLKSDEGFKVS